MQKYIIKIIAVIVIITCIPSIAISQHIQRPTYDLKIGDTIPNIQLKILNSNKLYNTGEMYKSGLLIINFWATWCVPCIRELTLLDSLNTKFDGKLSILSVAYEDSVIIKRFLKIHTAIHPKNMLAVTNDTVMAEYFKHRSLPHNIWIDKSGVIRAITGSDEITFSNINHLINGQTESMKLKKDIMGFDYTKPFHLGDSSFQYRSIFTKHIDGINSGCSSWGTHIKGMKRIFAFNYSIVDLFTIAYKMKSSVLDDYNLTEILTNDSLKFFRPYQIKSLKIDKASEKNKDWETGNLYCYDLSLPEYIPDSTFFGYMADDLKRMFHTRLRIENRPRLCNVIERFKGAKYNLSNYSSSHNATVAEIIDNHIILQNATLKDMVGKVLDTFEDRDHPWVDHSGFDIPIDLNIDLGKQTSLKNIMRTLNAYGLKVEQKTVPYPVMILDNIN